MLVLNHAPRFKRAREAMGIMAEREKWNRSEIETFQLERLNKVWRHAALHVPYFRNLAAVKRLPDRFGSLAEFSATMPILEKSTVRADRMSLLSEQAEPGRWRRTGGSTSTPMSVYWGAEAHRKVLRSRYRFYSMWGADILDRSAFFWGHGASFAPGLKGQIARFRQPLEDRMRNRLRLSAYYLDRDHLRDCLGKISAFKPAMIYAYSYSLYLLAREACQSGFFCNQLKVAVYTAEPAPPNGVEMMERGLGVPAACEYGSIDGGVMATEWPDRTLRVREDNVILETVPGREGGYEIVVTVLTNPSFPLLRYAIADFTDAPLDISRPGFAVLPTVRGRSGDYVRTRTGRYLHCGRFGHIFLVSHSGIRRYVVHQRADGSLHVSIELERPDVPLDRNALLQELTTTVEGAAVELQIVSSVPTTPAGKYRPFISDIPQP